MCLAADSQWRFGKPVQFLIHANGQVNRKSLKYGVGFIR